LQAIGRTLVHMGVVMRRTQTPLAAVAMFSSLLFACAQDGAPLPDDVTFEDPGYDRVPIEGDAGSACLPGAEPVECYVDPEVAGGDLVCGVGVMYCVDGVRTECQSVETFVIEGGSGLISGPDECNPCDPDCSIARDAPDDGDLTPDNSDGVEYDPGLGGITLPPSSVGGPVGADGDRDGIPDIADDCPTVPGVESHFGCPAGGGTPGLYHELPFGGPPTDPDPCEIDVQVTTADVYFLMDTTGSMGGEINNLRTGVTSGTYIPGCPGGIIGAIGCTIPDAWFGVGRHDDYPRGGYGGAGGCGFFGCAPADVVYRNVRDIAASPAAAQAGVNSLTAAGGSDWPESQSQALWAMATGNALGGFVGSRTCPGGRWGWPCFRDDAIPIVILFTDAPFHNGTIGGYNYNNGTVGITTPNFTQVVSAMNARGMKVISIDSSGNNGEVRQDLRALAFGTSSTDAGGSPFHFNISTNGSGLSSAVVDAVRELADYSRFDVSAVAYDNPSTPGIDERDFVESISAVSWGPGSCLSRSGARFNGCLPGTHTNFAVVFRNDVVMPGPTPQVFDFFIRVLLNDSTVAFEKPVRIVVPPAIPACAEISVGSSRVTPNVMLLVDRSGSMSLSFGGTSRWNAVRNALLGTGGVIRNLEGGVRFGLTTYTSSYSGNQPGSCSGPADTDCTQVGLSCGGNRWGGIRGSAASWNMQLNNFGAINSYWGTQGPGGGTPTGEAMDVLRRRWQATPPGVPTILILATDGEPNGCSSGSARNYVVTRAAALHALGIETYVISVGTGVAMSHLNDVARAGQGGDPTAVPFVATNPALLRSALEDIIGGVRSCELDLTDGTIDESIAPFGDVRLSGAPLDYISDWILVDEDTIELVGTACSDLLADPDATVSGTFPCPPLSGSYTRTYDSTESCDIPLRPRWGNFVFDVGVPPMTTIEFQFQTASTLPGLDAAPIMSRVVPPTGSPIDLTALMRAEGQPDRLPYVRMTAILTGAPDRSGAPVLRETTLTWDCEPDE